tara:strand:+ start:152 stop:424 length:273 start_codon:yes stop_codon:yes gene_type:complete
LEQKKQKYHDKTPEEKAKRKEANREHYLKNIDRIKAYAKAYRQKKKRKMLTEREREKLIKDAATIFVAAGGILTLAFAIYFIVDLVKKWY